MLSTGKSTGALRGWQVGAFALALAVIATQAAAQRGRQSALQPADPPLVTDLSTHLIAINSSFTGTDLLIFGSLEREGEVVVVVRGPDHDVTVRRKDRIAGIWINRNEVRFRDVPSFYAVASSRPLDALVSERLRQRLQIGQDVLRLGVDVSPQTALPYREGLFRNKAAEGLWPTEVPSVTFLGPRFFRTRIELPATVPVGTYRAEVYLIRDDRVIGAQATPLYVDKQGAEQAVYEFSREWPTAYGIVAVILAASAGLLAAQIFRRR